MPAERQTRSTAATRRLIDATPLQALRKALDLTQQQVAAALGIHPVAVSKLESQTDRYVSTWRRFIEARGGERRSVAPFPEGNVETSPFQREPEPATPAAGSGVLLWNGFNPFANSRSAVLSRESSLRAHPSHSISQPGWDGFPEHPPAIRKQQQLDPSFKLDTSCIKFPCKSYKAIQC